MGKYVRKTIDCYEIQTMGPGYGWETVVTETSYKEAKQRFHEYIENSCGRWVTRLVKTRKPITNEGE